MSGILVLMRTAILLPLLLGFSVSALLTMFYQIPGSSLNAVAAPLEFALSDDPLREITSYDDENYGFSVAVPAGWQKIIAMDIPEDYDVLEPGYAIGFEAPLEGGGDMFTDYIMIEIMPGNDSGAFDTDGSNRVEVSIDGRPAWIDTLSVNAASLGLSDIELTVYQAQISGLGFTVGLYAIGEPDREELMSEAFELLVRTFVFYVEPYETA